MLLIYAICFFNFLSTATMKTHSILQLLKVKVKSIHLCGALTYAAEMHYGSLRHPAAYSPHASHRTAARFTSQSSTAVVTHCILIASNLLTPEGRTAWLTVVMSRYIELSIYRVRYRYIDIVSISRYLVNIVSLSYRN
jgi:hypothetical protein